MTLAWHLQFSLILGLNTWSNSPRKIYQYIWFNQGIFLLILLKPSILTIKNVVSRIIYLDILLHHVLIMSMLKLMNMLMMILRFFWRIYGSWIYSIIHIYPQRWWCCRKIMVLIQIQFRWCDQTTKYHVQRKSCDEEEKIKIGWNITYS